MRQPRCQDEQDDDSSKPAGEMDASGLKMEEERKEEEGEMESAEKKEGEDEMEVETGEPEEEEDEEVFPPIIAPDGNLIFIYLNH